MTFKFCILELFYKHAYVSEQTFLVLPVLFNFGMQLRLKNAVLGLQLELKVLQGNGFLLVIRIAHGFVAWISVQCSIDRALHVHLGFYFLCTIIATCGADMDDGVHRENGRHKVDQYKTAQGQWMMQPQPSMKQIMAIMAERDAAIHERNMALSEKKAAIAERDMAFLQRDSAIAERNNALLERDNAIATLQYRENSFASGNTSSSPQGFHNSCGVKHMHHQQQHMHHMPHMNEGAYGTREMPTSDAVPISPVASEAAKPRRGKRPKDAKATPSNKKTSKSPRKVKRESEDLNNMFGKSHEWKNGQDMSGGGDDLNKQLAASKSDWKGQDLGLNQVAFDETTMPAPGCSCTGVFRQCYKWGNGGWQSSCCTTTLSMYPLPAVPNKRHARVGGRKMSGSAFSKLLSRLAADGHDLSNSVDLKDHWAKHGTNRYITIK